MGPPFRAGGAVGRHSTPAGYRTTSKRQWEFTTQPLSVLGLRSYSTGRRTRGGDRPGLGVEGERHARRAATRPTRVAITTAR